jgi:hypothetical protein
MEYEGSIGFVPRKMKKKIIADFHVFHDFHDFHVERKICATPTA